jgi:serine/threonine protein kinase
VHRDIKPSNILLGDDGVVKITDFGISRATGDVAVTKTGLIAGTPAYLAPEVAYGRPPEAPADVFSLGSTLYAAVEGEPPFGLNENTLGLLHAVAAGRINPPRQAGILTDVLIELLNADPDARPTAATAARWLDAVGRGQQPDITPMGPDTLSRMSATTALAPGLAAVPMDRTRAVTTVGQYGTGTNRGNTAVRPGGPPRTGTLDAPKRNRRPMVFAGIGVLAVAVLAAVLFASGALDHKPPTTQRTVSNTGPTQPSFQQAPLPTFSFTPAPTTDHHARPPAVPATTTPQPDHDDHHDHHHRRGTADDDHRRGTADHHDHGGTTIRRCRGWRWEHQTVMDDELPTVTHSSPVRVRASYVELSREPW